MSLDFGSTIAILIAVVGLIGIYIRQQVVLKSIQNRQDALEKRIEMVEKIIDRQTNIDRETKDSLNKLEVSIMGLSTQMSGLVERLNSDLWKR